MQRPFALCRSSLALVSAVSLAAISHIANSEEAGFRQHEAHVHGHVVLNVAQDDNELMFEFTAPGADVFGFEHQPQTQQQNDIYAAALATLNQADKILTLDPAGKCSLEHKHVEAKLAAEDGDEDEHHHDEATHEHYHDEATHDHEEHAHKGHEHEHHHHHHHHHGALSIEYHFKCENIQAMSHIDTNWFNAFPNTKEIDVNLLTDNKQSALELNPKQTRIQL